MLAYKVVEKGTRHCSNWTFLKGSGHLKIKSAFKKKHPLYFPRYFKNTTVTAPEGSIGILTFKSREDAEVFIDDYPGFGPMFKIVRVLGVGQPETTVPIQLGCGRDPGHLFLKCWGMPAPEGTITFRAVKVLE